jgi:hypothetical protein
MMKRLMVLIFCLSLGCAVSLAQSSQPAPTAKSSADATAGSDEEPDAPVAQPAKADKGSAESPTDTAWDMLKTALSDSETKALLSAH